MRDFEFRITHRGFGSMKVIVALWAIAPYIHIARKMVYPQPF
jgi:hypothetical protein